MGWEWSEKANMFLTAYLYKRTNNSIRNLAKLGAAGVFIPSEFPVTLLQKGLLYSKYEEAMVANLEAFKGSPEEEKLAEYLLEYFGEGAEE